MSSQQSFQTQQGRDRLQERLKARQQHRFFSWTDPEQIAANRQGMVTEQQRALLARNEGNLPTLLFVAFLFSATLVCGATGWIISLLFKGTIHQVTNLWLLPVYWVVTLSLYVLSTGLRRARMARWRRLIDAGFVEQVQGEIVTEGEEYVARTPAFQVTKPPHSLKLPPPGHYHFYVLTLRGQKILLSAEPIGTRNSQIWGPPASPATTPFSWRSTQEQITVQMVLCTALGFSLEDLEENRRGLLSETQQRKLSKKLVWKQVGAFFGLLVLVGLVTDIVIQIVLHPPTSPTNTSNIASIICAWIFFVAIIVSWFIGLLRFLLVRAKKYKTEIQQSQVQQKTGTIHIRTQSDGDGGTDYYYEIESLSFGVSEAATKALVVGAPYRVYYLDAQKKLLSVEPVV